MTETPAVGPSEASAAEASAAGAESFLADALSRPLGTGVRVVTIPTPAAAPERLLRGDGPALFWSTPGTSPAYAGQGVAVTLRGRGSNRFRQVRDAADRLFTEIEEIRHPAASAGPPRVFGGFSFLPDGHTPEWSAFGDATFVLPRLLYARAGDTGRLSVAITAADLREGGPEAILSDVRRLLERLAGPAPDPSPDGGDPTPTPLSSLPTPDPAARAEWDRAVAAIQRRIQGGAAEKIVAARSRTVSLANADLGAILTRLDRESSTAARFAFRFGGTVFVGATPERLVTRTGLEVRTEALAGSVPADRPEREARLLQSLKDEAEHGYVVEAIANGLAPLCERLDYPSEPRVQRLRHVVHLQTQFVGRLHREIHVLDLVERLHPTPAVGGLPTDEAQDWIQAEEPGSRGWYAAPVGWFDARGDGEFGVALRSGLIHDDRIRLFAGAGIVRGSDPAAEFEETEVKFRTMLDAVGALG